MFKVCAASRSEPQCSCLDLHDEELQTLRKARWAKAFADDGTAVPHHGRRRQVRDSKNHQEASGEVEGEKPEPESGSGMLQALRRAATNGSNMLTSRPKSDTNRKGTIVLEYLLQAADICHTVRTVDYCDLRLSFL